jgi:hypothetical protein
LDESHKIGILSNQSSTKSAEMHVIEEEKDPKQMKKPEEKIKINLLE